MDLQSSPPANLLAKIRAQIAAEENRLSERRRFFLSALCLLAALVAIYPIAAGLRDALQSSGFGKLASLAFSDTRRVLANWQDYALSLLESFPTAEIAVLLTLLLAVLLLIRAAGRRVTSLVPRRLPAGRN